MQACSNMLQTRLVEPRLRWIEQQRASSAEVLGLPPMDIAAAMAAGRSRVPPLKAAPAFDALVPLQVSTQLDTNER